MSADRRSRLARVTARSRARYERRLRAADWFCGYYKARWHEQPKLITRVAATMARSVPELATSPRRNRHICYEDCLHLEEQALILLTRLAHATATAPS